VAERLGVPYLDRAIPDAVAQQTGLPANAVADVGDQPHSPLKWLVDSLGRGTTVSGGTAGSVEQLDLQERVVRAHIEEFLPANRYTNDALMTRQRRRRRKADLARPRTSRPRTEFASLTGRWNRGLLR
jgi:hypothetical protein